MLIASLPRPQSEGLINEIVGHHLVDAFRFNTGIRVPDSPYKTLKTFLEKIDPENFWLDIKGRQLRIVEWAYPNYGEIILNHEIQVDLPAKVYFRGDQASNIIAVSGNRIYVEPAPLNALGAGQSINISGDNLKIKNYLLEEDVLYLQAAKKLGINNLMLSFVENKKDIQQVKTYLPNANMCLKIESPKGLDFVKNKFNSRKGKITLMAARDDLFINLEDKFEIISALKLIITKDPQAIVASRILTSLIKSNLNLGDISDLFSLHQMGYQNFMLSDSMSYDLDLFRLTMRYWQQFEMKKRRI